jgi:hypothetical protein
LAIVRAARSSLCALLAGVAVGLLAGCGPGDDDAPTLLSQPGQVEGLEVGPGQDEHFVIPVPSARWLRLEAGSATEACSIDLALTDGDGQPIGEHEDGRVRWFAASGGSPHLRVSTAGPGRCRYTLGWSLCLVDAYEPNGARDEAASIHLPFSAFSLSTCNRDEEDWFLISGLTEGRMLHARATFGVEDGNVDLFLYDSDDTLVASGTNEGGLERLLHRVTDEGALRLQVRMVPDSGGPGQVYDLDVFEREVGTTCPDDAYEPNDALDQSRPLVGGTYEDFTICPGDDDLFIFEAAAGSRLELGVDFTHAEGDIDLFLLDAQGQQLAAATSRTDDERLSWTSDASGTLVVRVALSEELGGMPGNLYGLSLQGARPACLDDIFEPDDEAGAATATGNGAYRDLTICPDDDDWFRLELSHAEELILDLGYDPSEGNVDLYLMDETGTEVLIAAEDPGSDEHVVWQVPESGVYLLRVTLASDRGVIPGNVYDLGVVAVVHSTCSPDDFEPNDVPERAAPLIDGRYTGLTVCEDEPDHYLLTGGTVGRTTARLMFDRVQGEIGLRLRDVSGALLARSEPTREGIRLDYLAEATGDHVLEVFLVADKGIPGVDYEMRVALPEGAARIRGLSTEERCGPIDEDGRARPVEVAALPFVADALTPCPQGDGDWWELQDLTADTLIEVRLDASGGADLQLSLIGEEGSLLARGANPTGTERLVAVVPRQGDYRLQVSFAGARGAGVTYDLEVTAQPVPSECGADAREPDDSPDDVQVMLPGSLDGLTLCPGDVDHFALAGVQGEPLHVRLDFNHAEGDLDLALLDAAGNELATSTSRTDDEAVYLVPPSDGRYVVRVVSPEDSGGFPGNRYALDVRPARPAACPTDQFEPNETASSASPVGGGEYGVMAVCLDEPDFYALDVQAPGLIRAGLTLLAPAEGDVALRLFAPLGNPMAVSEPAAGGHELVRDVVEPGIYVLEVRLTGDGGVDVGSRYLLELELPDALP